MRPSWDRAIAASLHIGKDSADSQFQIDLDSTDYEGLELMTQRDVLMMARNLLDKVEIDVP
jgi:hypothetical protein